jgi:hypothetical protein
MATNLSAYRAVEPALAEQRRAPRHSVAVKRASVRRHGREPAAATLVDLSVYGCRFDDGESYAAGERLWLRLDGGMPVAASVVWSEGGRTGCRFDAAIERSTVRALTLVIR